MSWFYTSILQEFKFRSQKKRRDIRILTQTSYGFLMLLNIEKLPFWKSTTWQKISVVGIGKEK